MIRARAVEPGDMERLREAHAKQGIPYPFPDLGDPQFLIKVMSDDPLMAIIVRVTAEAYLITDNQGEIEERKGRFRELHGLAMAGAREMGLADVHCWIPPEMEGRGFVGLLGELGWKQAMWPCYVIELEKKEETPNG